MRKREHPTSLSVQIENYVNWNVQRNLTPKILESYSGHLGVFKQYLASNGHSLLCDEITEEDITDYLASQRNKVCKQTSRNHFSVLIVRPLAITDCTTDEHQPPAGFFVRHSHPVLAPVCLLISSNVEQHFATAT